MQLTERFKSILHAAENHQCSDLHLSADACLYGRVNGQLKAIDTHIWSQSEMQTLFDGIATPNMQSEFERNFSVDAACSLEGTRYRINIYRERGFIAFAIRKLNHALKSFDDLKLPTKLLELAQLKYGLVLFTGPTGSGKSTSLAALIDNINRYRACHIITIEDPIEYLHRNQKSLVHQRELGTDVSSFSASLREALREDPDVILVGEMRDLDTIRAAITAAETGHLVFSTLHCGDAVGALDRILAMYPPEEQESIQRQLAMVLQGVVSQTLVAKANEPGLLPVVEILRNTSAVRNLISSKQFNQIYNVLEFGSKEGMQSVDLVLAEYTHRNVITEETALKNARNKQLFNEKLSALRSQNSLRSQRI
jgi:twitching motility protein PilT